jgi:hypothetical protein
MNSATPKRIASRCYTWGRNIIERVLRHPCCSDRKFYAELGSKFRGADRNTNRPLLASTRARAVGASTDFRPSDEAVTTGSCAATVRTGCA